MNRLIFTISLFVAGFCFTLLFCGCFDPPEYGYFYNPGYQAAMDNINANNIQTQMLLDQLAAQRRY